MVKRITLYYNKNNPISRAYGEAAIALFDRYMFRYSTVPAEGPAAVHIGRAKIQAFDPNTDFAVDLERLLREQMH